MILGVDASNISGGGGLTHLREIFTAACSERNSFEKVILWSGKKTLSKIPSRSWLIKKTHPFLNKSLPFRLYWQKFISTKAVKAEKCDILLVPGGTYIGGFKPFVAMSRNMLPFELNEAFRFKDFANRLRFILLQKSQTKTFRKSDGLIFLTKYAKDIIMPYLGNKKPISTIIPHGLNTRFKAHPKEQKPASAYSIENPFKLLYVSIVNVYKHQWHVVKAVALLRGRGYPASIEFVGPASKAAIKRFENSLKEFDPSNKFTHYKGQIKYNELEKEYKNADVFIFASSCEAFGQILTEAMSAGLPIACSNRSCMPEILDTTGVYFDPENPEEIANALEKLIISPKLRERLAKEAFDRSTQFSWDRCANETFSFIRKISDNYKREKLERAYTNS